MIIHAQNGNQKVCKAIQRKFQQGVMEFDLIRPNDKIMIAISGGKDSLSLVDFISWFRRVHNFNFELVGVHVKMQNIDYQSDFSYLSAFCEDRGVPFTVLETGFEADRKQNRTPCFLCSWTRRKMLFDKAQEWGCNKIAFGHHQDDILQTALMNLTFSGTFSTMPARLRMKKFPVTIIRPLCRVPEDMLKQWAELNAFQPLLKVCPFDKVSNRTHIKSVFQEMERHNPEARFSLWRALQSAGKLVE